MNYTQLTKKEQGRHRYDRHRAYVGSRRNSARRTRPSDIAPVRITDGVPMVKITQVFTHSSASTTWLDALMKKLGVGKPESGITFESVGPIEVPLPK